MLEKVALKIRKVRLGKGYRHLAHVNPDFRLRKTGDEHEMYWKKALVGSVRSYQALKNAYRGACFIVGSGPSVNDLDVRRLAPYGAITLNGAIRKYTDAGLVPRHHHMAHRMVFIKHLEYARLALDSGAQCFFPYFGISRLCEADRSLVKKPNLCLFDAIDKKHYEPRLSPAEFFETYRTKPGIYLSKEHRDRRGTIGFNCGQDHGFFTSNTVAVSSLQLAYYLGYRRIFLLGMEFGATGKSYFYNQSPEKVNDLMSNYDPDIKVCFELARQAAHDHGFEIYNLTPHSLLAADIIPRLSLDAALGLAAESLSAAKG